jgi:tetratricopeptide (TPR) repeat protein
MNFAEVERLVSEALRVWQSLGANQDAETATARNSLGETYRSQGLSKEAEQEFRRSIQIWEEIAGAGHVETAISLHNLAGALQDQERYCEAGKVIK